MAKAKADAEAAGLDAAAVKAAVKAAAAIPGMQPKPLDQLISNAFTALRKADGTVWLSELPREPLEQVLRDQQKAMVNYFEGRAGFPRFRRKRDFHGIRFTLDPRREQVLWSLTDTPVVAADRERNAAQKHGEGVKTDGSVAGGPHAAAASGRKPGRKPPPRAILRACFGSGDPESLGAASAESVSPAAKPKNAKPAKGMHGDGGAQSTRSAKAEPPVPTARWVWITLPMLGWVKMRRTEALDGRLLSVTFTRNGAGQWFASITADEVPAPAFVEPEVAAVGVDLGMRTLATIHDGETVTETKPAKPLRKSRKCLRRLNHKQDRQLRAQKITQKLDPDQPCPKGTHLGMSKRRQQTKDKLGKLHVRIACERLHATHELTTDLALRAALLVLESLSVKGLARSLNKAFRRSLHDVAPGELIRQLKYKAEWLGRTLETVDRFYPSSKTCSACLTVNRDLKLEKTWTCPTCGTRHDRDHNAAINLRRQGLVQVHARRALANQLQEQAALPGQCREPAYEQPLESGNLSKSPQPSSASAVPLCAVTTGEQPGRKARGGAKGPAGDKDTRVPAASLRRPSPVKREPTPESPCGAHPSPACLEHAGVGWG